MIHASNEKFFAWKCREFVITKLSFFMRQSVSSHHKDFMRGDIIKGVLICSKCNMSACKRVSLYKTTTNAIFICQDEEARWFKVQISTDKIWENYLRIRIFHCELNGEK